MDEQTFTHKVKTARDAREQNEALAEPKPGTHGRHEWDCTCSPELGPCADHDE